MKIDFAHISEATRLVRAGQLRAATAAIQAALAGRDAPDAPLTGPAGAPQHEVIDVQARVVPPDDGFADRSSEPDDSGAEVPDAAERFLAGSFSNGRDRRDYKLFVPAQAGDRPLPLVVMLHGCTQDPDDFAAGTGMNELADSLGFYVLYPAQSRRANPQGCWNWFKHSHQQRDRGEPALLAGMTRHVMSEHRVDTKRVYVAGLSAGGAMAAILGDTHPELYAAVGVHSGLASGSAQDLPSALSAMKGASGSPQGLPSGVPTIVFHGDADATVHLRNGEHVIAACIGATASLEVTAVEDPGVRNATRAIYRNAEGADHRGALDGARCRPRLVRRQGTGVLHRQARPRCERTDAPVLSRASPGFRPMERQRHGLPTRLTDASISKFSLGVTYTLSKRTVLYATGAWTRISDGQNNPTVLGVLLWWLDL